MMSGGGAASLSGGLDQLSNVLTILADKDKYEALHAELKGSIDAANDASQKAGERLAQATDAETKHVAACKQRHADLDARKVELDAREGVVAQREADLKALQADVQRAQSGLATAQNAQKDSLSAARAQLDADRAAFAIEREAFNQQQTKDAKARALADAKAAEAFAARERALNDRDIATIAREQSAAVLERSLKDRSAALDARTAKLAAALTG